MWITGLPASGKSAVASSLKAQLAAQGWDVAVLESDALRQALMDQSRYDPEERDRFYRYIALLGAMLVWHGVPVIFDATANRRIFRERARQQIARFLEVYVDCPLAMCIARDPKGIYQKASQGAAHTVPGLQEAYEPPEAPDLIVHSDREQPETAAQRVIAKLIEKGYIGDENEYTGV